MKIMNSKISDLKFAPYNPRKIDTFTAERLKTSIQKFGVVDPLIVNKKTKHVVGGNQRLKVLKEMGVEEVPTVFVDLSLDAEKALNLALNKISGDWDYDKLKPIFDSIEGEMRDLTGFGADEIAIILQNVEEAQRDFEKNEEIQKFVESAKENSENPQNHDGDDSDDESLDPYVFDEAVSYAVILSFPKKEEAESWLKENDFDIHFRPGAKTTVIRMQEE